MMPSLVIQAEHPTRGILWAAVDPKVRFIEPSVCESRFGARLAPFTNEEDARLALEPTAAMLLKGPRP